MLHNSYYIEGMTKNEALPPLSGTNKQIAWAEKIRVGLDAELDARLAHFAPEIADRYRAVLIGVARRLTMARWWIDSRDFVFKLLLQERTDEEHALCKEIEQASRELRTERAATPEPVTMKTSEVRKDMRKVIAHVEGGGTVIVEHYNRPVATIAPYEEPTMISQKFQIGERVVRPDEGRHGKVIDVSANYGPVSYLIMWDEGFETNEATENLKSEPTYTADLHWGPDPAFGNLTKHVGLREQCTGPDCT